MKGEEVMSVGMAGAGLPAGGSRHHVRGRARLGGIKFGAALFGWITATGVSVVLTAITTAIAAASGAAAPFEPGRLAEQARQDLQGVSILGAVVIAVVLFISYFCGGYVAGRMARFDGVQQGLGVWLWAVIMTAVAAVTVAVSGPMFTDGTGLSGLPRIPIDEGTLTAGGALLLIAAALITLAAAVLGGKAGMHYHRKIDRAEADPALPATP